MIQEIITFLIVTAAVIYALSGVIKKPLWKKKSGQKTDFRKETFTMHQHNCSGCSAECMLRDSVKPLIGSDADLCRRTEIKQKL